MHFDYQKIALTFFCLLLGGFINTFAQQEKGSLESKENNALDSLFSYGYDYIEKNIDSGLSISKRLLQRANKKENTEYVGYAYYLRAETFVAAIKYDLAADYYKKALEIFSENNDTIGISCIYNALGVMSHNYYKYDDAIYYYTKALELDSSYENDALITKTNIARSYLNANNFSLAEKITKRLAKEANEKNDSDIIYITHEILADIHFNDKKFEESKKLIKPLIGYYRRKQSLYSLAISYYYWADLLLKTNEFNKVLYYANKGYEIEKLYTPEFTSPYYYHVLKSYYTAQGDYKKALEALEESDAIKAKLIEKDQTNSLNLIKADYDFKAELEKEKLKRQLEIESNLIKLDFEKSKTKALFAVIIFVLLCIGYFILNTIKLKKLYKSVSEANNRAQESNEALKDQNIFKEKLIGLIAHDSRSPLASISSVLQLAKDGDLSTEERDNLLDELGKKTKIALEESEGIINWAKAQMNGLKLNIAEISLKDLLDKLSNNLEPIFHKKELNFHITVESNCKIAADVELLKISLKNLLVNAAKFSYKHGTISIKAVKNNGKCQISITDNGIGMNSHQLSNLFKPHIATQLGTQNEKGTGLGLLQCYEFIQKMHGSIYANSVLGQGSTFTIELPLKRK